MNNRVPISYITQVLRDFRREIKLGKLEDAISTHAHLMNILKDLDNELDKAWEARELSEKLKKLREAGALSK